jgi:hypothetical protein
MIIIYSKIKNKCSPTGAGIFSFPIILVFAAAGGREESICEDTSHSGRRVSHPPAPPAFIVLKDMERPCIKRYGEVVYQ